MKMKTLAILASVSLCLCVENTHAAQYSKFEIVLAAKRAGKWDALKAWIDVAGYSDEWLAVEYLLDDNPQLAAITNAVVATGIASAEEVAAILSAARDTAPDALIAGVYKREVRSESGRVKWHGARVSRVTDVEAMEYISTYEDGTVFRDPAPKLRQAAAATNRLTKGVSARLAAARLRRLEEAQRTNTVSVVVTPDPAADEPLPEEPPEPDADPHSSDQGSED